MVHIASPSERQCTSELRPSPCREDWDLDGLSMMPRSMALHSSRAAPHFPTMPSLLVLLFAITFHCFAFHLLFLPMAAFGQKSEHPCPASSVGLQGMQLLLSNQLDCIGGGLSHVKYVLFLFQGRHHNSRSHTSNSLANQESP